MTAAQLLRDGRVVARDGAVVEIALTTPCQSCRSRCLLGADAERRLQISLPGGSPPQVGEQVEIAVGRSELTRTCVLLFGMPLLAWICGGLLGSQIWGESAGVWLALLLLVGTMSGMRVGRSTLRSWIKLELIAPHGQSDAKLAPEAPGMG